MPDLTLLCPGTLRPAPVADARADLPPAVGARGAKPPPIAGEALASLLQRARVLDRWHDDSAVPSELPHERWLRARFGLPAACTVEAMTAHADGVAPPALRLTPVHLRVARDHLVLTDPAQLALDADDARALAAVAATVFAEQALTLTADRAEGRWYLAGDALPALSTRAWTLAVGRNVDAWSAAGADARRWRKLVNEIQMLWHIDPVNERRAEHGRPPVNGLWADGMVATTLQAAAPFAEVVSEDPALIGLACLAGTAGSGRLQVLDGWRQHLRDPEADGGRVLRDAAAAAIGRAFSDGADRLTVVLTGERSGVTLSVARADGWKFWQRLDPTLLSERTS